MSSSRVVQFLTLVPVLISGLFFHPLHAATTEQCLAMNPQKVLDVQACLASKAELSGILSTSGQISGCNLFKSILKRDLPPERRNDPPGCRVIAKALTNLNGQGPFWEGCIDHAEGKGRLKQCFASLKKLAQTTASPQRDATCKGLQLMLNGIVSQMIDNKQMQNYKSPDCKQIARAWNDGSFKLAGMECTDYKPNNEAHVAKCLKPELAELTVNPGCDKLRKIYLRKVKTGNGSVPGNYQIPTCTMLDKVAQQHIMPPVTATKSNTPAGIQQSAETDRASNSRRRTPSAPSALNETGYQTRSAPVVNRSESDQTETQKKKLVTKSNQSDEAVKKQKQKAKNQKDKLKEKQRKLKEKLKKLELKF